MHPDWDFPFIFKQIKMVSHHPNSIWIQQTESPHICIYQLAVPFKMMSIKNHMQRNNFHNIKSNSILLFKFTINKHLKFILNFILCESVLIFMCIAVGSWWWCWCRFLLIHYSYEFGQGIQRKVINFAPNMWRGAHLLLNFVNENNECIVPKKSALFGCPAIGVNDLYLYIE